MVVSAVTLTVCVDVARSQYPRASTSSSVKEESWTKLSPSLKFCDLLVKSHFSISSRFACVTEFLVLAGQFAICIYRLAISMKLHPFSICRTNKEYIFSNKRDL